mmetsp:Transcript_7781/g.20037  ORF Transcript_7781/g.20037 Transcript_7781/m.20037 type:complete len:131 (-) Transcript_7781:64-456(-)
MSATLRGLQDNDAANGLSAQITHAQGIGSLTTQATPKQEFWNSALTPSARLDARKAEVEAERERQAALVRETKAERTSASDGAADSEPVDAPSRRLTESLPAGIVAPSTGKPNAKKDGNNWMGESGDNPD